MLTLRTCSPRIDSDLDNRRNAGVTGGGYSSTGTGVGTGHTGTGVGHGTTGTGYGTGTTGTTGTGYSTSTNAGPHNVRLLPLGFSHYSKLIVHAVQRGKQARSPRR